VETGSVRGVNRGNAIVRDGERWLTGNRAADVVVAYGHDAFAALDEMARGGFWVGFVAYDLGRAIERVHTRTIDDLALPDLAFARLDDVREAAPPSTAAHEAHLGAGRSSLSRAEHASRVDAIHSLLRDGECYQVNLTRRLEFDAAPDPAALFGALSHANPAPYAALCSFGDALPGVAVVSASPELFLRVDGRAVETRPIKGTAADPHTLSASTKDRAENLMIVDLARNDFGRVCEYGSVHVPALFEIEAHPGLHHLVSTVRGRLRDDVSLGALMRATFPPASVTGAPKPRVLQAIEDLEPVRRGVYCGAVGWIDGDRGRAELAVAIRTFTIASGRTYLGVGGGIVADSVADAEWAETELKAARLMHAVGAHEEPRPETAAKPPAAVADPTMVNETEPVPTR
jgi:para-aminobenzoate synthetase component 1